MVEVQPATRIVAVLSHPAEVARGLPWAAALARNRGIPVTLAHVIDAATSLTSVANAVPMAEDMMRMLETHVELEGLLTDSVVRLGLPEEEIPALAGEDPGVVTMLVGGEHGFFARSLLSRGRENVLRHLRNPFVFLPPRVMPAHEIKRVVVGVDRNAIAQELIQLAGPLASESGLEVIEVEVTEPGDVTGQEFLQLQPEIGPGRVKMRGLAGTALLTVAQARDAGMIAVGSHGAHRSGRFLGATAQWLAHHADRPVLVVPNLSGT